MVENNMQPSVQSSINGKNKKGLFMRFLAVIEKYGNKLPDPLTILIVLSSIFIVLSFILAKLGIAIKHPATGETVVPLNLLSAEGVKLLLTGAVGNLLKFPPFGDVLVIMLGVGLAEASGLIQALMKRTVVNISAKFVIPAIALVSILGNLTVDAALIVFPPMAAMALAAFGINPIGGLVLSYACVMGAYSANLVVGGLDVQLSGMTALAAKTIDPSYTANPAMNYYFLVISTIVLVIVATFVMRKITIPSLSKYTTQKVNMEEITDSERRGLRWAGTSLIVFTIAILALILPPGAILRNQETGSILMDAPFVDGLIIIITLFFLIPALFYGIGAKSICSDKDVSKMLGKTMGTMGPVIVLFFFAAQMTAIFQMSNIALVVAVKGGELLSNISFTGLPLAIVFIIVVGCINLFIGSSTAKWSILAPAFIPMFMLLGYDPAYTQMLYRIGDSISNPIIPISPFLFFILGLAKTYDPKMQLGSLLTLLLPYSIFFALVWIPLIIIWVLLGLPFGPGGGIFI